MTAFVLAAAAATSTIGVLGGLGGAVLLVPALILAGMPITEAAPLGLLTAGAGSLAAAPRHLTERLVNHRLGVTIEVAATAGAVGGALVSGVVPERPLVLILAAVALAAALVGGRRTVVRNPAQPELGPEHVGEEVGALGGAHMTRFGVAPYKVKRIPAGLALVTLSGVVAGTAGASGGFIKTPVLSELMNVPTKVAAATTTFTIGITSAAALVIFAIQGRVEVRMGAAAVLGGLLGALAGARYQAHLPAIKVRRALSVVLVVVAVVLVLTS